MHLAVGLRWEEAIKFFIEKGASPNARNKKGETPLLYVAHYDYLLNSTKLLLENNADVNLTNNKGQTPLMYAAYRGASNNMKALIKAGANIYIQDRTGATTLMFAAEFGNLEIVQELISQMEIQGKMEVDTLDNYGKSAIFCATFSKNKKSEILRLLLSKSSFDVNREYLIKRFDKSEPRKVINYSLLNNAIYSNNDIAVEFLLANGANILYRNNNNISGLKIAIALNRPHFVMLLLKGLQNKLDENRDGIIKELTDAIYLSAEKDRHEILKMLLPFLLFLEQNSIESQEQMVLNCFRTACVNKSKSVIHYLLSDKNMFSILNRFANDLLLEAVYYNIQTMVEVLLGNSFDVNINYKNNGQNFLFIAIKRQYPAIVSLLLDKGININDLGEAQVAHFGKLNEDCQTVTPIMHASRLLIKLEESGAAAYIDKVFDLQIAMLILSKMIWNELKDNYIKDLLLKCPRGEAFNTANDIKSKIQVFSEKVLALNILFDIKNNIYFLVDSKVQSSHRFALLPEVFKSIYEIQKNKGSFNYKDFMQYIVKYENNLGEKLKKEKKQALHLVNLKTTQLLSKISSNAAIQNFPKIPKPLVLKADELSESGMVNNNQMLIFYLLDEIYSSNLFLESTLARDKFDENRLVKLKQVNEGWMSRIKNHIQEFNNFIKKLKDLQENYITRYLELSKEINHQLEVQGIEVAEKSLEILSADPMLVKLLLEAEMQETKLQELSEEFSKTKDALVLQRNKETRWELSHHEKQNQSTSKAMDQERFNKSEKELKKNDEDDKRRLEAKLKDEATELKRRKEKQALEKEKRRAYAVSQEEERKRKNEQRSELFSNPQPDTMNLVPNELKENEERRKRHFPLTMTIASKSNLSMLISLSPEALILKEMLNEIEILTAHDFLGSPADKLGARKACLGMMARITEIAFNNEGSIFPALHAEHFRDVIWHAKNEFISSFSDEGIFNLTKIMAQYVFSVLKNDIENTSKVLLSLKQNKVYNAILEHDLRLKHEPFEYSYYECERKLEKDQEAQLKDCIVLSPVQLEHARGHSVGRIGAIIRRIKTYYYDQYKSHQENYDNVLTADRLRVDRECYLIPGRKYRHAESLALDSEISRLYSIMQSTKEVTPKSSVEHNSNTEPSFSAQLSVSNAFLPQYNKSVPSPKVQDIDQNEPTVRFTLNTDKQNKKTKSKRKNEK